MVPFAGFLGNLPGQSVNLSFEGKILTAPSTLDVRQMQMSLLQALFEQPPFLQQRMNRLVCITGSERSTALLQNQYTALKVTVLLLNSSQCRTEVVLLDAGRVPNVLKLVLKQQLHNVNSVNLSILSTLSNLQILDHWLDPAHPT